MRIKDRTFAIANGKLAGEDITFNVGNVQLSGRLSGNIMKGMMVGAKGQQVPWEARRREGK